MSGHKGMKRRNKSTYVPEPCVADGTGHWRSWAEVADLSYDIQNTHGHKKMTKQNLCLIGRQALTKIAAEMVLIMGGSIEPQQLITNTAFIQIVEEELRPYPRKD